jgi:hypothetical protein
MLGDILEVSVCSVIQLGFSDVAYIQWHPEARAASPRVCVYMRFRELYETPCVFSPAPFLST